MESQVLKYIQGELDFFEKKKIITWINKTEENHKKFNVLKAKYVASKLYEK